MPVTRPVEKMVRAGEPGDLPEEEDGEGIEVPQERLPDPGEVRLPVGEMPTEPGEALDTWLRLYKEQLELTATAERLADERYHRQLNRDKADLELEASRIALAKARLELAEAERAHAEQRAAADHARVYFFNEEVTEESVHRAIDVLGTWSRRDPEAEIRFVINSPGGLVVEGLALFDFLCQLRATGHRVTTVALGMAASMAGVLLQAGDERLIGPNASLLVHEVSRGMYGKASELEDGLARVRTLQRQLLAILAGRSRLSERQIAVRWKRKDWWLTADEAIELGFADGLAC